MNSKIINNVEKKFQNVQAGFFFVEIESQASIARMTRCSRDDHQKCIALADPLLKDPHLIFPDNMKDIDRVCR